MLPRLQNLLAILLLFWFSSDAYSKSLVTKPGNSPLSAHSRAFVCGTSTNLYGYESLRMKIDLAEHGIQPLQLEKISARSYPIGNILVIEDNGLLVRQPTFNLFDLNGKQLRFTPMANGAYQIELVPFQFDSTIGIKLNARDESNHLLEFQSGFNFPFFGKFWEQLFVNSNGVVSFGKSINASRYDPNDFFQSIPMIAVFFADLNPEKRGSIFYRQESDRFIITWNQVTEFGFLNSNTFQLTLRSNGVFEISYAGIQTIVQNNGLPILVGVNSGAGDIEYRSADLSNAPVSILPGQALFEAFDDVRFREVNAELVAREFYKSQPDSFDQLVLLTDFDLLNPPYQALHILVKNDVQGIGRELIDRTANFGSAGRLQSFIHMNSIQLWPDPPDDFFFIVLSHETAHRWGSFIHFNLDGQKSDLLLGSGLVHWSFFLDSDASVLEGNDWRDNGDGTFTSIEVLDNYSFLDHYLMGFRRVEEVPPFFFINKPGVTLDQRSKFPLKGALVQGPKRWVTIQDVVTVEGARAPGYETAQKDFRQAFILLTQKNSSPSSQGLNKLEEFRNIFPQWFNRLTDGRATMQTKLQSFLPITAINGIITSLEDGRAIANLTVELLERKISQFIPSGGHYAFRLLSPSGQTQTFTLVARAFPFFPDTLQITLNSGEIIQQDFSLKPLTRTVLSGNLTNSSGQGIRAKLTLFIHSDLAEDLTMVDSSDANGHFDFENIWISFPGLVRYDSLTIEPEIPYLSKTFRNLTVPAQGLKMDITLEPADILLVNDDPQGYYGEFYQKPLSQLNLQAFHWVEKDRGVVPVSTIKHFNSPILIWFTGDAEGEVLTVQERDSLKNFLQQGGRLFLTGQNIAESLAKTDFLKQILHVTFLSNTGDLLLHGVKGDPIGDFLNKINLKDPPGANNQTSPDVLRADSLAHAVVVYDTLFSKRVAAIRAVNPETQSRLVFLGFGFEAISPGQEARPGFATPTKVMEKVLNWLNGFPTLVTDRNSKNSATRFNLFQNYPNPFNQRTIIRFRLPDQRLPSGVKLVIFNILGEEVRTLIHKKMSAGEHQIAWDGRDDRGTLVPSGVYILKLKAGNLQQTRKLIYLR